jgi:hypothetical protein
LVLSVIKGLLLNFSIEPRISVDWTDFTEVILP